MTLRIDVGLVLTAVAFAVAGTAAPSPSAAWSA
jgi:hypothetical protein